MQNCSICRWLGKIRRKDEFKFKEIEVFLYRMDKSSEEKSQVLSLKYGFDVDSSTIRRHMSRCWNIQMGEPKEKEEEEYSLKDLIVVGRRGHNKDNWNSARERTDDVLSQI